MNAHSSDHEFTAADYDEKYFAGHIRRYEEGVYGNRVKWISKYLDGVGGKLLLDAGCGIGFFSEAARHLGANVVSLDFSPQALGVYRRRGGRDAALVAGSVEELPFADNEFDFAMAIDVIEHLYHPNLLLSEMYRVVRPGGRVIVETDNEGTWFTKKGFRRVNNWAQARTPLGKKLAKIRSEITSTSLHVETFDFKLLAERLEKIGFKVIQGETFPYLPVGWRDSSIQFPPFRPVNRALGGENCMIYLAEKPRKA
ncbi:MAG: class I SAM-dependent methyltransferase [Planctomycetota bacterium]